MTKCGFNKNAFTLFSELLSFGSYYIPFTKPNPPAFGWQTETLLFPALKRKPYFFQDDIVQELVSEKTAPEKVRDKSHLAAKKPRSAPP